MMTLQNAHVKPLDFIRTARKLANGGGKKPQQADLRRAQSTAYYAMFHCLAKCSGDMLVGATSAKRSNAAWRQVYRSLSHTQIKSCCTNQSMMTLFPTDAQDFANVFIDLQVKRHDADYNPKGTFYRSAVLQDVEDAETAIKAFQQIDALDKRAFAAFVVLGKPRRS